MLYICKQEQKRNEYAKEYKKEKQNGHLPCDAPCEHRVPCSLCSLVILMQMRSDNTHQPTYNEIKNIENGNAQKIQ